MPRLRTQPRTFSIPSPAPGADWVFTPSQTDRAVVMSVTGILTTAVAAANRFPALTLTDQSGLVYYSADVGRPQAASLVVRYTWARDVYLSPSTLIAGGQSMAGGMPDVWLDPNDTIGTVTNALAAADQWSSIVIRYYTGERWLELQRELQLQQYLES